METTLYRKLDAQIFLLKRGPFRDELNYLLGSAYDNANDTVYVEKAADEVEWEKILIGSLQLHLCERTTSNKARRWFAKRGIAG